MSESVAADAVEFWAVGRIKLHHRVDVQQSPVALEQNRQGQLFYEGQVSSTVADCVGVSVVGDLERRSHSLTRLDIPSSLWRNTGVLPQGFFEIVGTGTVTPGDKRRIGLRNKFQRGNGAFGRFDLSRIIRGTDNNEVIVHYQAAVQQFAFCNVF